MQGWIKGEKGDEKGESVLTYAGREKEGKGKRDGERQRERETNNSFGQVSFKGFSVSLTPLIPTTFHPFKPTALLLASLAMFYG